MTEEDSNNFLGRWLNNELSDQELSAFENSPDFAVYKNIVEISNRLRVPHNTTNEEDFAFLTKKIDDIESEDQRTDLLHKWLNDDLTESELKELQTSKDFQYYSRIVEITSNLKVPHKTTNQEDYDALMGRIDSPETKVIPLFRLKNLISIAASVLILFGISVFILGKMNFTTDKGQQTNFFLPDGSEVVLNSNSTASFNKYTYSLFRNVVLDGEAYFQVAKAKKFTVKTSQGNVSVLGTTFNVKSRNTIFSTQCFEGRVQVTVKSSVDILTRGNKLDYIDDKRVFEKNSSSEKPDWFLNKQSKFKNVPLNLVLEELKNYYDIDFVMNSSEIDLSKMSFVGVFVHDNLDIALESVFLPMNITYKKKGNQIYIDIE